MKIKTHHNSQWLLMREVCKKIFLLDFPFFKCQPQILFTPSGEANGNNIVEYELGSDAAEDIFPSMLLLVRSQQIEP